jgi:hypothetical protein
MVGSAFLALNFRWRLVREPLVVEGLNGALEGGKDSA